MKDAIGLSMYGFLLLFNSNIIIWPNMAPLQDTSLPSLSDLEFDLSRSLNVKSNSAARLPIHDFLISV